MYKTLNLATEPQFRQANHETWELKFGLASIQIKQNGTIIFKNPKANLILTTDGNITIDGLNIYLNSTTKGLNHATDN